MYSIFIFETILQRFLRSGPVGAGAGAHRYRPVPPNAGAADRPQETLYLNQNKIFLKIHSLILKKRRRRIDM